MGNVLSAWRIIHAISSGLMGPLHPGLRNGFMPSAFKFESFIINLTVMITVYESDWIKAQLSPKHKTALSFYATKRTPGLLSQSGTFLPKPAR